MRDKNFARLYLLFLLFAWLFLIFVFGFARAETLTVNYVKYSDVGKPSATHYVKKSTCEAESSEACHPIDVRHGAALYRKHSNKAVLNQAALNRKKQRETKEKELDDKKGERSKRSGNFLDSTLALSSSETAAHAAKLVDIYNLLIIGAKENAKTVLNTLPEAVKNKLVVGD